MGEPSAILLFTRNPYQDTGNEVKLFDTTPSAEPLRFITGGGVNAFEFPVAYGWSLEKESRQFDLFDTHRREAAALRELENRLDVEDSRSALQEPGETTLDELKAKLGL